LLLFPSLDFSQGQNPVCLSTTSTGTEQKECYYSARNFSAIVRLFQSNDETIQRIDALFFNTTASRYGNHPGPGTAPTIIVLGQSPLQSRVVVCVSQYVGGDPVHVGHVSLRDVDRTWREPAHGPNRFLFDIHRKDGAIISIILTT